MASMGPHSFKCGKHNRLNSNPYNRAASMGPHSFKCGKRVFNGMELRVFNGFNGAALFQVRKVSSRRRQGGADDKRFNGAALFQVRKESLIALLRSF